MMVTQMSGVSRSSCAGNTQQRWRSCMAAQQQLELQRQQLDQDQGGWHCCIADVTAM
jgi:hypothetical protein